MKKIRNKTCYFCGKQATSFEHVPPKCLFPQRKDVEDEDYRKELIRVPSCDKHNAQKSRDDEFLMVSLAPIVGNNDLAFRHTKTKIQRAHAENPHLANEVISDAQNMSLALPEGVTFPVLLGKPDTPRLCRALEATARGLYFHENGKRFKGKVAVFPSFVKYQPGSTMSIYELLCEKMIAQERHDWEVHGRNPEVFTYQIGSADQYGLIPMVMTFYSRAEVLISFQPKGVRLPHRSIFDATPKSPVSVEIKLGEGEDALRIVWRCTGD